MDQELQTPPSMVGGLAGSRRTQAAGGRSCISVRPSPASTFDVMAAIFKILRHIKYPIPSVAAYLRYLSNNPAKFHPDPI